MKVRILLPMLLLGAITLPARGGIIMTMQEVGADVVLTSTGTLGGINSARTDFVQDFVTPTTTPNFASLTTGTGLNPSNPNLLRFANVLTGPDSFGTGVITTPATSSSGPILSIALGHALGVDAVQALADAPLTAGSSTWSGFTLASLGVTPGTYTWTVEGALLASGTPDTIVLNIVPADVPVPGPLSLLLAPMAMLGWTRWRATHRNCC